MKLVRYFLLLFLFVFTYTTVLGQLPDGFNKAGTMFRDSNSTFGLKYILLDPSVLSQNIKASKVIFKKSLYTAPKQTDLTIEIFNIFFDKSSLAVFSVMPSLHIQNPEWKKININNIKSQIITLSALKDTINSKLDSYPVKDRGIIDPLKYYNYVLVIKKADGYYFNTTDCITEFFKIVKSTNNNPAAFKIDTNSKMLSIAEYESGYRRKHGEYSSNFSSSENSYFNDDVKDIPRLNLSYVVDDKGKRAYKFWLLDQWVVHNSNFRRGMDRFTFKPGVGVIAASYDFYMNGLINYWYNKNNLPPIVDKSSKIGNGQYIVTPYFTYYKPLLLEYLDEQVINYTSVTNLNADSKVE